jgi:hypothetical protein
MLTAFVQLPEPIQLAILSGVTLLLGLILAEIANRFPWLADFLGQYKDEIAIAIAGVIVTAINGALATIPVEFETAAGLFLQFVVAVLAALGVVLEYRRVRTLRAK